MDQGFEATVGTLSAMAIPIVSIVGGLLFAGYAMWLKARLREMHHRERMAMIEKGMTPPPDLRWDAVDHDVRSARRRSSGLFILLIGIGLAITLGYGLGHGLQGYSIGGFVAFLGLARLIVGMVEQRWRLNSTTLGTGSQPPAM